MAMKIPEREREVPLKTARVSPARKPRITMPRAIPGAFGAETARATQELARAGEKIAEHLQRLAIEEQDKEVLSRETSYRQDQQDRLLNQEDETIKVNGQDITRKKGFLARQLGQAKGATEEMDKVYYDEMRPQYLEGLSKYQTGKLAPAMDGYYLSVRNKVITHEANQRDEDFKNTTESNLQQKALDASLIRDGEQLSAAVDEAVASASSYYNKYDEATRNILNDGIAKTMTNSAVTSTLTTTGPESAKLLLESMKDKVSGETYNDLKKELNSNIKTQATLKKEELIDLKIGGELTEEMVLRERAKGHITASDAQTFIKSLRAKPEVGALDKSIKFNELVERNADLSRRESAWFGLGKTTFEENAQFRADVLEANAQGYITDKEMKELLEDTSKAFYREPVFQKALNHLASQSDLYVTPAAQAQLKAQMYGNLIEKVIAGKKPNEAVDEVIRERIDEELSEAVKVEKQAERIYAVKGKKRIYSEDGGITWRDAKTNKVIK